jgi:hypothetical protein
MPSSASSSPTPTPLHRPTATSVARSVRAREGTAGRLKNPDRSTCPRTSTLRISHSRNPRNRRYNPSSEPGRPRPRSRSAERVDNRGNGSRCDAGLQPLGRRPANALNSAVCERSHAGAGVGRGRGWDDAGVDRGTGHVGCDGGVLSVVVPRPHPRLRAPGRVRGSADRCCGLHPPRWGDLAAVIEVLWLQGRPARSNSRCSRGRRRWVWRSSAIRLSTSAWCSLPAASLRMVASRRAARR